MTRLLVSIPPSLRGEIFTDLPNSSLQHRLIRSWHEAGFKPISMNTPCELKANPSHQTALANAGVESLEVPSTGVGFPDYLPNLTAALRLAVDRFAGEVPMPIFILPCKNLLQTTFKVFTLIAFCFPIAPM
jgi:hypothetical protein